MADYPLLSSAATVTIELQDWTFKQHLISVSFTMECKQLSPVSLFKLLFCFLCYRTPCHFSACRVHVIKGADPLAGLQREGTMCVSSQQSNN